MVLSHLPFDVIASIFLHLDPQDIEEAGKVCSISNRVHLGIALKAILTLFSDLCPFV